jgi:CHAT domain-containing protein
VRELREELNWFYSRLNRAEEEELEDLIRETGERELRLAEASRRMASTSHRASDLNPVNFSVETVIGRLGTERAFVEFIEREGVFSAFVITSEGIEYVSSIASSDEVSAALESLQFQFGAMRYGGDALKNFADNLKTRADACLAELYELTLLPLRELIGERDLVIVPSGVLNYVPFPALFDGERYEAEEREIATVPGAAVWEVLEGRDLPAPDSALVIGFADEHIPNVESETAVVAALFKESKVLTGTEATFGNYESYASSYPVLHLACHGRFRPDNPLFSSLHLSDGFITVRDICARRIDASIVTLSACETGLNRIYPGSEILGLARGFLTAGAASIVLSLWTVNDEATARLMTGMYRGLQRGLSVSASLNLERGRMIEEGAHPYFWAPFGIIGRQ